MKKAWTEHVGDFIAGKGFYIILFLCVAAIGISGYYLLSTFSTDRPDTAVDAAGDTAVRVTVTPAATPSPKVTPPAGKVTPAPAPAATPSAKPSARPAPTPTPVPTPAVFTWPVKGTILHDFSLEVLSYDVTMGDWRTHSGVDIAANVGDQVFALSAGTVTGVYTDDLMGTTVVIDHADGLRSSYSNLAGVPAVKVGDTVKAGGVIGAVGETALAESDRAAHLHLEMSKDGLSVDPEQFLP